MTNIGNKTDLNSGNTSMMIMAHDYFLRLNTEKKTVSHVIIIEQFNHIIQIMKIKKIK